MKADSFSDGTTSEAPLDPGFLPMARVLARYEQAVAEASGGEPFELAVERNGGCITSCRLRVFPAGTRDEETFRYVERIVKFVLWSSGGWRLMVAGANSLCERLAQVYSRSGARAFDVELMEQIYDQSFVVDVLELGSIPEEKSLPVALGGHFEGCRIGFDLGASDYKISAVIDGEAVFSTEIPWNPRDAREPEYHRAKIREGLELAASHLPRVDAIGGSSAGVYVNNEPRVASLFRSVPKAQFESRIKCLFRELRDEWRVPLELINDGDVTALAGALSLEQNAMLGVAMGSSEATGYLDRNGRITGRLNELAFAPVDMNPAAARDEWSGDAGVGAMYFSQQAVNKLAPAAGVTFPENMGLPERLKEVQKLMETGHDGARRIFETIGVYLGHTISLYRRFYDYDHLLVLGRVTSGAGGDTIVEKARQILRAEYPALADSVQIVVPDEKARRVGQSVAAASLPMLAS